MLEFENILELDEKYEEFHITKYLNSSKIIIYKNNSIVHEFDIIDGKNERTIFSVINSIPMIICIVITHRNFYYDQQQQGQTIIYKYESNKWIQIVHQAIYLWHDNMNIYMWDFDNRKIFCYGTYNEKSDRVLYTQHNNTSVIVEVFINGITVAVSINKEIYFYISQIYLSVIDDNKYIHVREEQNPWTSIWHTISTKTGIFNSDII